jgi:hypothetical protein
MEIVLLIILLPLSIWFWWRIFSRAGYPGWFGILMHLPLVNLVVFFMLVFGDWPVLQELKKLKYTESMVGVTVSNTNQCPKCGLGNIHKAYIEDGSWGDWCPNCKESLQKMRGEI